MAESTTMEEIMSQHAKAWVGNRGFFMSDEGMPQLEVPEGFMDVGQYVALHPSEKEIVANALAAHLELFQRDREAAFQNLVRRGAVRSMNLPYSEFAALLIAQRPEP